MIQKIDIAAAILANLTLVRYLIGQLAARPARKFAQLQRLYPAADPAEWELIPAGQRAQLVTPDRRRVGVLQQGTELVVGADGTIAGLLGASPGASTAVPIMLELLERSFPDEWHRSWQAELTAAIPGLAASWDTATVAASFAATDTALGLAADAQS